MIYSSAASGNKTDGTRSVCLRNNVMTQNLGASWADLFEGADLTMTSYPGSKWNGKLIALYTGANTTYFQLTILDDAWITPAEA